jgi:hypothetical protein
MVMVRESSGGPDGKISATFLDFASPLIETISPDVGSPELEVILKLAFTVWNAVVFDAVKGDSRFVDEIRQATASDPGATVLVEQLLRRKRLVFADDHRLIGNYQLLEEDGTWILRAEARDPRSSPR